MTNIKEDFRLIWLDETLDKQKNDLRDIEKIREVVQSLRTYTDPVTCLDDIKTWSNEKIFLIVSGTTGQVFVPLIHDLSQIQSIYIFCLHKKQQTSWTSGFSKIKSEHIFNNVKSLLIALKIDLFKCEYVSGDNIKVEKSIFDVHQKTTDFKWSRLLAHTLTKLVCDERGHKEMIDYLRGYYVNNQINFRFCR